MRAFFSVLLAAVLVAPAMATHGLHAEFDTPGGNEWWVEVYVDANEPLDGVDARADGGAWVALEKKSWGAWAKSFHVPDGSIVEFRARAGGDEVVSPGHTWPSGEPASGGDSTTGGDGGGSGDLTATYTTNGGNAWWVEVYVDASEPLAGVDARADGGAWVALEKKSWGAWAKSFHVPDGSLVQFRATGTDGDRHLSGEYRWPGGEQVSAPPDGGDGGGDGGTGGTGGTGFDATFRPKPGNAWWIEADVQGHGLAAVDVRADGGDWVPMTKRSWGAWAVSTHAPQGSLLQFRATDDAGERDFSAGGWVWTKAEPHPPLVADFRNVQMLDAWVQVNVYADGELKGVDARLGGSGQWHALEQQDWGDWASPLDLAQGMHVQFRAHLEDGRTAESPVFATPKAPLGHADTWPLEGSFVRYESSHGASYHPGGPTQQRGEENITFSYVDGDWQAHCEGWGEEYTYEGNLVERDEFQETAAAAPPRAPVQGVDVGDHVMRQAPGCSEHHGQSRVHEVDGKDVHTLADGTEVPVWHAVYSPPWHEFAVVDWHDQTGLVVRWSHSASSSGSGGEMTGTDAPIGKADPAPMPPERQAWPFEGSHVEYTLRQESGDNWTQGALRVEHDGGYWQGVCEGGLYIGPDGEQHDAPVLVAMPPRTAPVAATGEDVLVEVPSPGACDIERLWTEVSHQEDRQATQDGEPVTVSAWYAHEADGIGFAYDVWWETDTRLVLEWRTQGRHADVEGRLEDTDAPIGA